MKKILFTLFAICMAFAACEKEPMPTPEEPNRKQYPFSFAIFDSTGNNIMEREDFEPEELIVEFYGQEYKMMGDKFQDGVVDDIPGYVLFYLGSREHVKFAVFAWAAREWGETREMTIRYKGCEWNVVYTWKSLKIHGNDAYIDGVKTEKTVIGTTVENPVLYDSGEELYEVWAYALPLKEESVKIYEAGIKLDEMLQEAGELNREAVESLLVGTWLDDTRLEYDENYEAICFVDELCGLTGWTPNPPRFEGAYTVNADGTMSMSFETNQEPFETVKYNYTWSYASDTNTLTVVDPWDTTWELEVVALSDKWLFVDYVENRKNENGEITQTRYLRDGFKRIE